MEAELLAGAGRLTWHNMCTFLASSTTNAIESLNSVIRHTIKKRKVFLKDDSLKKVIWLAMQVASKKDHAAEDWRMAMSRVIIECSDRLDGHC